MTPAANIDRKRVCRVRILRSSHLSEGALHSKTTASEGVFRVIDVIGSSATSWEDATRKAVETAGKSLRDLRIAEVTKLDVMVEVERS